MLRRSLIGFRGMAPREHPAEGAQDWALAPAHRGAATAYGPHSLDEATDHREQHIEASKSKDDATDHVESFLCRGCRIQYPPMPGIGSIARASLSGYGTEAPRVPLPPNANEDDQSKVEVLVRLAESH